METWKQQRAMRNFLIGSEFASENMRKQFQAKYKELLGSSLEKQGQMFDDNNLDERERPSSPISEDEDFKLASRNVGKWLRDQAKTLPERPSSSVREFINKNVINPIFKRHSRNSSTTSLPQIPSKLKNEVNPEENEEEFKLQNPPISRLKRQRSIVLTTLNQSSNTNKWRKNRKIRRKMFEESKKEDITSDDERNMKELDTQYPVARNSDLTDEQWQKAYAYTSPEVAWQNYETIQQEYESDKEEETQGYGVPDSEDGDSLYAHFKEMPVEVRHIILPTVIEGKQVDYKVYCNENIEVPPMNIGHIRIENPVENGYIGTPVNLAKKGIIVQPGIVND
ncbi:6156_t:CDS:2, partial [Cetraspora pellucida]